MVQKKLILTLIIITGYLIQLSGQAEDRIEKATRLSYDWKKGFINITELTGGPGIGLTDAPYAKYCIGLSNVAGYQFTRNIKAGLGVGLNFHNDGTFLPLFLDARFSLNANEFVPFFAAAGGVTFNLSDPESRSWIFINPSLGLRWVVADRRSASLSAGLMTMSGKLNRNSFINIKLGIEVKGK